MPRLKKSSGEGRKRTTQNSEKAKEFNETLQKYEQDGILTINVLKELKSKLPFKSPQWILKNSQINKEKQHKKNLKQLIAAEAISNCTEGTYTSIEASKSMKPACKYCDFTGLKGYYKHKETGIRYNSPLLYQEICKMPLTIVNGFLELRKALIEIK